MNKPTTSLSITLFILVSVLLSLNLPAQVTPNHRMIVLTDIEADPDDTQTLVRLLLYANVIDIEGIIATTSTHMKNRIHPESIQAVIQAYGKVLTNLKKHEAGYPEMAKLLSLVKRSIPEYGMEGVGEGKDTEGSEWIIERLEAADERPLWISVWGGANTLAQALFKMKATKPARELNRLIKKLRVYTISDQDDSAIWIRNNFPDLFYIVSPGGYGNATWISITQFIPGINNETVSNSWLAENIQQGHGPLGACYPDVAYGMEGDTPAWLSLIPNGLNAAEYPNWGGWGGRYELYQLDINTLGTDGLNGFTGGVPIEPETRPIWTNAVDKYTPVIANEYGRAVREDTLSFENNKVTLWRWRDDFQNDFAARMDWCTQSFEAANHPPVPALAHSENLSVKSGEMIFLDASGTSDPDGDNLSYFWFHYPEAGSYKTKVGISSAENIYRVPVRAPEVEQEETLHFILKVTDKGWPPLSRYKRVIVKVLPK